MGGRASGADRECLEFQVPPVYVVTREIQASKEKRELPLLDPQAHLDLLEWMARRESQEPLHLVTQDPPERGVFQEHQA